MGIEKRTAQMTVDQRGAIALFEGMGFRAEALLANQVRDRIWIDGGALGLTAIDSIAGPEQ